MKGFSLFFLLIVILFSCTPNTSALSTFKGKSGISYKESLKQWIKLKKAHNNSYEYQVKYSSWVGFGHSGVLKLCGFVPNDCADDCYEGVSIDSFKWLE